MPWVLAAMAASSLGPSTTPAWGAGSPPSPLFFTLDPGSRGMSLRLRGGGKRRASPVDEESSTLPQVSPRRGGAAAPVSPETPDSATKGSGRKGTRTAPGVLPAPGEQVEGKAGARKRIRLGAGTASGGAGPEALTEKGEGPAEGGEEEGGVAGRSGVGRASRDAEDKAAAESEGAASKAQGAPRGSMKGGFLEGGLRDPTDVRAGGASRGMGGGARPGVLDREEDTSSEDAGWVGEEGVVEACAACGSRNASDRSQLPEEEEEEGGDMASARAQVNLRIP